MKAALALGAIVLILLGRLLIYRTSKQAWQSGDSALPSIMARINADHALKLRYRLGQGVYLLGIVLFAICFFI